MNDPEEAAYTPAGRITNEVVDIDEDSDRSRGPRLPSGRSSIDLGVETEGQQQGGLTIQAHDFEQPSKSRMLRRSTKRIERPDDEDDEMEYSLAVKRSKQAGSGSDGRVRKHFICSSFFSLTYYL